MVALPLPNTASSPLRYAGGKGDDVTYEGEILGAPSASILLLGAFHFEDAGRDWYKPQHDVDILSASRQREIIEVVDRLAHYAPTKIAVERTPEQQGEIDEGYAAYLRGNLDRVADEIYQLGFRLAAQLGHRRVCGVNAWDRHYEPDLDLEVYAREHSQEDLLTEWSPRYQQLYEHDDRLLPGSPCASTSSISTLKSALFRAMATTWLTGLSSVRMATTLDPTL